MNNQTPLVSVIMAVYNAQDYLKEAIDSILTQTYEDIELIIVNDGSNDLSQDIIEQFRIADCRVVSFSHNNKGLPHSLNECIKLSKGKYIARMDADDISLPNRIEEQVRFMEVNPSVGVCGTWAEVFGGERRTIKHPVEHEALKAKLLFNVCFVHPTVMIRRCTLINNNLTYNTNYVNSQDYKLWSELSKVTIMANIPKVLFRYRVSENSITSITNKKNPELRYNLSKGIYESFLTELNLYNTEEEYKLHFNVGVKDRIKGEKINLNSLNLYFNKISKANKMNYDKIYLSEVLAFKFVAVVIFRLKIEPTLLFKCLFYKFFYLGLFGILKNHLK